MSRRRLTPCAEPGSPLPRIAPSFWRARRRAFRRAVMGLSSGKKLLLIGGKAKGGEQSYLSPGSYTFIVPPGVTSICIVAIGAGANGSYYNSGGGGGALAYRNNIPVSPGQSISIFVPAASSGQSTSVSGILQVGSASGVNGAPQASGTGVISYPGGNGGQYYDGKGGGGGASGGYNVSGGSGASYYSYQKATTTQNPDTGSNAWTQVGIANQSYTRQEPFVENINDQNELAYKVGNPRGPNPPPDSLRYPWSYSYYAYPSDFPYFQYGITNGRQSGGTTTTYSTAYEESAATGTAGSGRGGATGQMGEGVNVFGLASRSGGYGAGGGAINTGATGGAIRIIWGKDRAFPSTQAGQV